MADTTPPTDAPYEKARDLAEAALEEYAHGHLKAGDKLAEKAVKTDSHAVEDLVDEMGDDDTAADAKS